MKCCSWLIHVSDGAFSFAWALFAGRFDRQYVNAAYGVACMIAAGWLTVVGDVRADDLEQKLKSLNVRYRPHAGALDRIATSWSVHRPMNSYGVRRVFLTTFMSCI